MRLTLNKFLFWTSLAVLITNTTACSYYSDATRQKNLCKSLSRHVEFQQASSTLNSPAQYRLCGDNCHPCESYTPIFATHLPKISNTKKYKKHISGYSLHHPKKHKTVTYKRRMKTNSPDNSQSNLQALRKIYERN